MKEKTPYCPACQTDHYVVLDKRSTQLSTAHLQLHGELPASKTAGDSILTQCKQEAGCYDC